MYKTFCLILSLRERPTGNSRGIMEDLPNTETEGALLGLPETQTELDVSFYYNIVIVVYVYSKGPSKKYVM